MLVVGSQELFIRMLTAESQAACQVGQGFRLLRQPMGLSIIHHLKVMFQ